MNEKEIITAWKCCSNVITSSCKECPLHLTYNANCVRELMRVSLDLYNRQKAENFNLKEEVKHFQLKNSELFKLNNSLVEENDYRKAENERLVELLKEIYPKTRYIPMEECQEKTADFLLDNGIVVPPVKVGDTLYYPKHGNGEIVECEVTQVRIIFSKHKGRTIQIYFNSGNKLSEACFTPTDFKYGFVHYTREDAEKALGGGEK